MIAAVCFVRRGGNWRAGSRLGLACCQRSVLGEIVRRTLDLVESKEADCDPVTEALDIAPTSLVLFSVVS